MNRRKEQEMTALLVEYFREMGRMGGKKNSKKQQEHRKKKAVRAMLKAKFPADPRWK